MYYLVSAVMVLIVVAVVVLHGGRSAWAGQRPPVLPQAAAGQDPKPASRADLEKRLRTQAESESPKELAPGAMCYEKTRAPERVDYVCPKCGEKTLYAREKEPNAVDGVDQASACRRLISEVAKHVSVELDESEFCKKCGPKPETPRLALVVRYPEDKEGKASHRVSGITVYDLLLLSEFLSGKEKHKDGFGRETPLKDHMKRIRELLGIGDASRADLEKRLRKLAESEPPKELSPGAMCYQMAAPPDRIDYVCPKCGEKTLYVREKGPLVADCRRLILEVAKHISAELDESEFCGKCVPKPEMPRLVLVVRYPEDEGKPPHRVIGVNPYDLLLLSEFLSGKEKHEGDFGRETPLKDHLKRIRELLGVGAAKETESK